MIGHRATTRGWVIATAISVSVHAAAAGALVWQPHWQWNWNEAPASDPAQIELTALSLPGETGPGEVLSPVSTPVPAPELSPTTDPQPGPDDPADPGPDAAPLLQNMALPMASGAEAPPPPPPDPVPAETTAETDPRLVELFQRIQTSVTGSCLLALPALTAEGQIRLNLLAANDGPVPGLLRDLTQGLETEVTGQAILLDSRQCPALAFARRDPRYPVFPLAVQLQSQDVAAGDSLRGTVTGGAGRYVTLLMVDDNGVTHDLRRFLINSGGRISFDVPVARDGQARDTHQLILAVATGNRPTTISDAAGNLAQDFFDQLGHEIGTEALIGVASAYIR